MSDEEMNDTPQSTDSLLQDIQSILSQSQTLVFNIAFSARFVSTSRDACPLSDAEETTLSVALSDLQKAYRTLEYAHEHVRNRGTEEEKGKTVTKMTESYASGSKTNASKVTASGPVLPEKTTRSSSTAATATRAPSRPVLSRPPLSSLTLADTRILRNGREPIYFMDGGSEIAGNRIPPDVIDDVNDTIQRFFGNDAQSEKKCIAQRINGKGTLKVDGDRDGEYSCRVCVKRDRHCVGWKHAGGREEAGFVVRARFGGDGPAWKNE
ncbi:hypothetical protein J1614_009876 [Plenodomus biglobosus]|nr:hypothetical protein J1614_009876 [Plenodomus biglobosus]